MTAFSIFVLSNFLDILFYVFGHFVLPIIIFSNIISLLSGLISPLINQLLILQFDSSFLFIYSSKYLIFFILSLII